MKKLAMFMAVMGLILVGAVPAQAASTWTVDAGGGGDFTTIQAAIDDTGTLAGDTLSVVDGTYTITAAINVSKGVTITGNVANPGNVLVQYAFPVTDKNCFDVTVNNVTVQGVKAINGSTGFFVDRVTGCKVSNNIVSTFADKGIVVNWSGAASESERVEVTSNVISDCGNTWGAACIQTWGSPYTYIYGNTINATNDKGINIIRSGATGTENRIQVIGNDITGTKWPGIQVIGAPYTYVHGNTLTNCDYGAYDAGDWDYASIHVQDDGAVSGGNVVIDGNTVTDGINGIQTWSDNVSITENDIHDMGKTYADETVIGGYTYKNSGILVGSNWGDDPSGVIVLNNNIYDNYWGLFHSAEMGNEVDALCNWWGNAGGPGVGGANDVGDLVDVSTWLDGAYPGGECVPEPATMCLLGLGALGLIRRRRRK